MGQMEYLYSADSENHYATNVRKAEGGKLTWISKDRNFLIVRTPFGESAEKYIEEICRFLSEKGEPEPGRYTRTKPEIYVMPAAEIDKARGGVPLSLGKGRYTVFCCVREGDTVRVYKPLATGMNKAYCDVSTQIEVKIERESFTEKHFLKTVKVESDFYKVTFKAVGGGYSDGDINCLIGDLCIPVPQRMIEAGEAWIESGDERPSFASRGKGVDII